MTSNRVKSRDRSARCIRLNGTGQMVFRESKQAAATARSYARTLVATRPTTGEGVVNVAHAPACRGEGDIRSVRQLAIAGDHAAADRLYGLLLASGQCLRLKRGTRVLVERVSVRGMATIRIPGDDLHEYYMDSEQLRVVRR